MNYQPQNYNLQAMALYVASLNSGSNGNCYYIGNEDEAVLVDVGISCREVEKRLKRLDLPPQRVKAILITHEHGDHIHGAPAFAAKFNVPVYITTATLRASNLSLDDSRPIHFTAWQNIQVGKLEILPFPKIHDAIDPHSFTVSYAGIHIGIMTDIGRVCEHVSAQFKRCHAVFLESNYDVDMLERGAYPLALKNRIRNGSGHLSNEEAYNLLDQHKSPWLSHVFLSHLSRNNNSIERVQQQFDALTGEIEIVVAPRDRETPLFFIDGTRKTEKTTIRLAKFGSQLSLF